MKKKGHIVLISVVIVGILVSGIAGYLYWSSSNKNLAPVQTPANEQNTEEKVSSPEVVNKTENGMENWKTYSNTDLLFEIKYPSNWKITNLTSEEENVIIFNDPNGDFPNPTKMSITIIANKELDLFISDRFSPDEPVEERYLGGLRGKQFDETQEIGITIVNTVIKIGDNLVNFSRPKLRYSDTETVDKVLSTFKFLPKEGEIMKGWKTYNGICNYEIHYPPTWTADTNCISNFSEDSSIVCLKSGNFKGQLAVPADEVEIGTTIIVQCSNPAILSVNELLNQCQKDKITDKSLLCQTTYINNEKWLIRKQNEYYSSYDRAYFTLLTISGPKQPASQSLIDEIISTFKFL